MRLDLKHAIMNASVPAIFSENETVCADDSGQADVISEYFGQNPECSFFVRHYLLRCYLIHKLFEECLQ
jgi:hypothetical protein